MPPEGGVAAPPVAPSAPVVNTPNAPRTTGTDSLRNAIRAFGDKMASGELTLTDDSPGAPVPTLSEVVGSDGGPGDTDGSDDGSGAAQDGAAPNASGLTQDAQGRWHNPDGSFARDPNLPPATVNSDETDSSSTVDAPDGTETEPETVPFTLKGITDRGEQDEEIEVPKALEERFRRLTNDANRYREVAKRMDVIEAKEADFQMMQARMQFAPDAWVVSQLPAEAQRKVALAILAEQWDHMIPDLAKFDADPSARALAAKDNQIRQRDLDKQSQQEQQRIRAATKGLRLIEDLIPQGATANRAERFVFLAKAEVDRQYQATNQIPSLDQIRAIATEVAADMGFAPPAPTNGEQPAQNGNGKTAPKPAAPQSPRTAQGTARQNRVDERKAQVSRSRVMGRRMTPAGAGGAPTMMPPIPQTSSTDKSRNPIKERIAFLRQNPGHLRNIAPDNG